MDFGQRPVVVPALKIVVQRAARRQIARNVAPLTARAQNIHDAVQYLPDVDLAPSAATLGGRDQVLHLRPLGSGLN